MDERRVHDGGGLRVASFEGWLERVIPQKRKKGEAVKLHCSRCNWSTDVAMADTSSSQVFACAHCDAPIYWHACESCGLCYAGVEKPSCPVCDDTSLDDVSFD